MVDVAQIPAVGGFVAEYQSIARALDNLAAGGRIVAMEITGRAPPPTEGGAPPAGMPGMRVSTEYMEYP